jgi:crotonobetainyl-CoA:carnitine CoA-transferase CaiB-like acyl-CoA transferase
MQSTRDINFPNLIASKLAEAFKQLSASSSSTESSLPKPPLGALSGIPIVGIAEHIAGPLALGTLTTEGALCVSIEPPSGDPARKYLSPECFSTLHAGKMSVAMDLKKDPNYPKVLREACIIIDNRSKRARDNDVALQQFLKDPDKTNRVIYCYISGFPGEDESRPGNDVIVQASTGMAYVNAPEEAKPLKVGFMLLDFATADWAVISIQSRLIEMLRGIPIAEEANKVIPVHVNMASVAARFLSLPYLDALQGREVKPRNWNQDNYISVFSFFKTSDGRNLSIGTLTDTGFKIFCEQVIDKPELASRFPKNELRLTNNALIHEEIGKVLATQTLAHWTQQLTAHNIPHAPVERVEDAVKKPYAQHLFSKTSDGTPIMARPDGRKPELAPAPTLDQHGKTVDQLIKISEQLRLFQGQPTPVVQSLPLAPISPLPLSKPIQQEGQLLPRTRQKRKLSYIQMEKRLGELERENAELKAGAPRLNPPLLDQTVPGSTASRAPVSGYVNYTSPSTTLSGSGSLFRKAPTAIPDPAQQSAKRARKAALR